jgi:predicted component of type VI protein secretion system
MSALTIKWYDAGQEKTQTIYEQQPSKNPGTVRIGRDPLRCDIVISHATVSGLHVEIFFNSQQQQFLIRNLREQNPPVVDGKRLTRGERPLNQGSIILLGQTNIQVTEVSIIEATVLSPPPVNLRSQPASIPIAVKPALHQNQNQQQHHQPSYGLECPRCHRISPLEHLEIGCQWCGTSLAAAASVLVTPNQK